MGSSTENQSEEELGRYFNELVMDRLGDDISGVLDDEGQAMKVRFAVISLLRKLEVSIGDRIEFYDGFSGFRVYNGSGGHEAKYKSVVQEEFEMFDRGL